MTSSKLWLLLGSIFGCLSVALGAMGAHGLKGALEARGLPADDLTKYLTNWETAARYQMYHALALLAVGMLAARGPSICANLAGHAMTLGTLLFSGCLYAWVLGGPKWLVHVVPIGGTLLIIGWVCLIVAVVRQREQCAKSPAA
ncbi:MAG: DUF423 domain-containing protein [Pirellulaceae bacterium]|nr:DUF423 domain-containing protein [Pirellulaceae bacterium]